MFTYGICNKNISRIKQTNCGFKRVLKFKPITTFLLGVLFSEKGRDLCIEPKVNLTTAEPNLQTFFGEHDIRNTG